MRRLTFAEIEEFTNRRGVKRIAVETFLMTVSNNETRFSACANAQMDASLYKWNQQTLEAILDGIGLASRD